MEIEENILNIVQVLKSYGSGQIFKLITEDEESKDKIIRCILPNSSYDIMIIHYYPDTGLLSSINKISANDYVYTGYCHAKYRKTNLKLHVK